MGAKLRAFAVAFLSFRTTCALVSEEVFDEISIKMVRESLPVEATGGWGKPGSASAARMVTEQSTFLYCDSTQPLDAFCVPSFYNVSCVPARLLGLFLALAFFSRRETINSIRRLVDNLHTECTLNWVNATLMAWCPPRGHVFGEKW